MAKNSLNSRVPLLFRPLEVYFHGVLLGITYLAIHLSLYFTPILIVNLSILLLKNKTTIGSRCGAILAVYTVAFLLEVFVTTRYRNSDTGTEILAALCCYAAACYGFVLGRNFRGSVILVNIISFVVLMTGNFFTYFLGITKGAAYSVIPPNLTLGLLGVHALRADFLFSIGINAYGTLLGLVFALCALNWIVSRRIISFIGASLALLEIFLVDSRGALLIGGVATLLVILLHPKWQKMVLVGTLVAPVVLFSLAEVLNRVFSGFSRIGADVSSGRIPYWSAILDAMQSDVMTYLFGVGLEGPNQLGIDPKILTTFSNYVGVSETLPGAHNMWLQLIVEGGILNAVIAFIFFYATISDVAFISARLDRKIWLPFLSIIYVPVIGLFESSFDHTRFELSVYLFSIFGAAAFMRENLGAVELKRSVLANSRPRLAHEFRKPLAAGTSPRT